MSLHSDIRLLNPDFQKIVIVFLKALDDAGIKYIVNETLRDKVVQEAYYAQGREPLETTNKLRKEAGLWELSEEENKRKVTWTMKSPHLDGLAIDIVPLDPKTGKAWWNAPQVIWNILGTVSKKYGLHWGGEWKNPDCPHIEQ